MTIDISHVRVQVQLSYLLEANNKDAGQTVRNRRLVCAFAAHMLQSDLRAILCKYGASYLGTISRSDSDFDETC